MPVPYLKKLSKEGKGSVPSLEKKWDDAGKIADKAGKGDNYAYRTGILKNMVGAELNAATRLVRTVVIADSFEGWINTLGYKYSRKIRSKNATLEAASGEVIAELKSDGWRQVSDDTFQYVYQKGDHKVALESDGPFKTTLYNLD